MKTDEPTPAALDRFGRVINYLRVSVTDACNLRCVYCIPPNPVFRQPEQLLQNHDIIRLGRIFASIGFERFRFTGGEPTLRAGFLELVRAFARFPGVRETTLTTNGTTLHDLAEPLYAAGIRGINVRLDSLDPVRFRHMSRGGDLGRVMSGLIRAWHLGIKIKLNCTVVAGLNDQDDIVGLAQITRQFPWDVRFIEVMPIGRAAAFISERAATEPEIRSVIEAKLGPLLPADEPSGFGPARYYRLYDAKARIGFISAITHPFCAQCNRARLTCDGKLRLCLLHDDELDLVPLLRGSATDEEIAQTIRDALMDKPARHDLDELRIPRNRSMSQIGG